MRAGELAKHFEIDVRRVHRLKDKSGFPPVITKSPNSHWDLDSVVEWMVGQGYWDEISESIIDARFYPKCVNCGHAAIA
jgi:hypothetical protein